MKNSLRSKLLPQSHTLCKQMIIIARQDDQEDFFTQLHLNVIQIDEEKDSKPINTIT